MSSITPAILAHNITELRDALAIARTLPGCDFLHIDIMDGVFVPTISVTLEELREESITLPFELHLMVAEVEPLLPPLREIAFRQAIVHAESTGGKNTITKDLHTYGKKMILAANPETPIDSLPTIDGCDGLLIMGVEPGRQGAPFLSDTLQKVRHAQQRFPGLEICVDGGVGEENASELIQAGATRLVVGSRLFRAQDPRLAWEQLLALTTEKK